MPFVDDADVELVGVEVSGEGIETGRHGAPLTAAGMPGVLHGAYSAIMQDEDGQILEAHSISAGLDYPGSGPETTRGLATPDAPAIKLITDAQALDAFARLTRLEGIIPGARKRPRDRVDACQRPRGTRPCVPVGQGKEDLAEALQLLGRSG